MDIQYHLGDERIGSPQSRRIKHQMDQLGRRLVHFSEPTATLTVRSHPARRAFSVDLRVALEPNRGDLVSHQEAATPDHAVRLAVADAERQLERRLSDQRNEATFGVPSRRLPRNQRPKQFHATAEEDEQDVER